MSWYLWIKWLHIVSSTVLFGTGFGIAFFFVRAQRTRNVALIASVGHDVVLADAVFTATAVASSSPLPAEYKKHYRRWFVLGWPAFVGVLVIFYLMVAKPRF
jgi:uncharacterized membrane protein